jgi:hypothetical protein
MTNNANKRSQEKEKKKKREENWIEKERKINGVANAWDKWILCSHRICETEEYTYDKRKFINVHENITNNANKRS